MIKSAQVFLVILTLFITSGIHHEAQAATWLTCNGNPIGWRNASLHFSYLPISFPQNHIWRKQFEEMLGEWQSIGRTPLSITTGDDSNNTWNTANGVNEIFWSSSISGSVLAYTWTRYECYWAFGWKYKYVEADIGFNTNYTWSTSYNYDNSHGAPFSFKAVALHEIGHAIGLKHESNRLATMNPYYPFSGPLGETKVWHPHSDDKYGARIIYGSTGNHRDLVSSVYKKSSPSFNSSKIWSPVSATAGNTVNYEYTFENHGTQFETFNIGFYLSKNRYITTDDIFLSRGYGATAPAGSVGTFNWTVSIPSWVPAGSYYLGFILDDDQQVPENENLRVVEPTFPIPAYPPNYHRDNHISLPFSTTIYNNTSNQQYHLTAEVFWSDIDVSAFGWTPQALYIAFGNVLGSSAITYGGCTTTIGIADARFIPHLVYGQVTRVSPPIDPQFTILFPQFSPYVYPMSNTPKYVQAFALAPNGCFVETPVKNYRHPW